jgi:hypothetical protein
MTRQYAFTPYRRTLLDRILGRRKVRRAVLTVGADYGFPANALKVFAERIPPRARVVIRTEYKGSADFPTRHLSYTFTADWQERR